jgi:4-hydroxy-3-polyprenylbenzoate decarboxylase
VTQVPGRRPWVVGVSGASGTPYAAAVLRALLAAGEAVDLVVSRAARLTLLDETGRAFRDAHWREDLAAWLARGADGKPDAFGPHGGAHGTAFRTVRVGPPLPAPWRAWTTSAASTSPTCGTGRPATWPPDRPPGRTRPRAC